jgi:hypothetical protein
MSISILVVRGILAEFRSVVWIVRLGCAKTA